MHDVVACSLTILPKWRNFMKKANFFIIGAPKCGTTALSIWLKSHPDIYFSEPKEPCFFNTDIGPRLVNDEKEYLKLFLKCPARIEIIGEGSTFYLMSKSAAIDILRFEPKAKIIVMLRNPCDLVVSLHNQELRSFNENIDSFEAAWDAQSDRAVGRRIPRSCVDPVVLQYEIRARIGSQLEYWISTIPRHQIKVILFDDLCRDPKSIYKQVLEFLALDDDGRELFSTYNARSAWRMPVLQRAINSLSNMKRRVGINASTGVLAHIGKWNTTYTSHTENLSTEFKNKLNNTFLDEILKVEEMTGLDLSHWRMSEVRPVSSSFVQK